MKWYVIHTQASISERQLREKIEECGDVKEAYYPLKHREYVSKKGEKRIRLVPLLPNLVFVRGEKEKIREFIQENNIPCNFFLDANRDYNNPMVIKDDEMAMFKKICEYHKQSIVYVRKPYHEFIGCDIVSFREGPLAGFKGKLKEIKKDRKVIFQVQNLQLAISNSFKYPMIVECPAFKDTEQRQVFHLIDACLAHLQAYGYVDDASIQLRLILLAMENTRSMDECIKALSLDKLSDFLCSLTAGQLSDFATLSEHILIRKTKQNLDTQIPSCPLRPFLTIHSGNNSVTEKMYVEHKCESCVSADGFTEVVQRINISERYLDNPGGDTYHEEANTYYAHVGIFTDKDDEKITIGLNFNEFYSYYESLEDKHKLHEKLQTTGATIFYKLLTETHEEGYRFLPVTINNETIYCLGKIISQDEDAEQNIDYLIALGQKLCEEITNNVHLISWRRHLSTVWLRR